MKKDAIIKLIADVLPRIDRGYEEASHYLGEPDLSLAEYILEAMDKAGIVKIEMPKTCYEGCRGCKCDVVRLPPCRHCQEHVEDENG